MHDDNQDSAFELERRIRSARVFASLPAEGIEFLARQASLVAVLDGAPIDAADSFCLIVRGQVVVSHGERPISFLEDGDFFDPAILPRHLKCASLDYRAIGRVELVTLNVKDLCQVRGMLNLKSALAQVQVLDHDLLSAAIDKGLLNARRPLLIDLQKCTRCLNCICACADSHGDIPHLHFTRLHAREQVIDSVFPAPYPKPSLSARDACFDKFGKFLVAVSCRSCDAPCIRVCPHPLAIHRGKHDEIVIENDICTGCKKCLEACPFDALVLDKKTEKPTTCDLCGGDPECVRECPHDALERMDGRALLRLTLRSIRA